MMNRDTFLSLIGAFPRKPSDPSVQTVEIVDCGAYRRHKLTYNVEDGESISAYVCIPKDITGKVPGIFCHHQHMGEFDIGKSEVVGLVGNPDQAYAAELAERGYVTFASDALAFEDRNWHDEPFLAETYEGTARISLGTTFMAKLLHDITIGIDVLSGIDEVDVSRIGFIGHSYGGKMAFWAAAYDHRIRAAVASCGSISLKRSLERDAGILPELMIPGFLAHGDVQDVASLAEAAFLISGASDDVWSEGSQELRDTMVENGIDAESRMYEGEHCFRKDMREYAYDFLDHKLPKAL